MTYIQKVRQGNAAIKMQVQNLLGWDDLQYATFQQEQGYAYLRAQFDIDTPLVDRIPEHKEYWSWWRLHWIKRDREFLDMSNMLFKSEMEEYYRQLHDPESMAFWPHAAILEETYTEMIHQLVKGAVS